MSNKWETWIIELAAYIWNVTLWAWFCFYLPHLQISSNFTSTTPSLPSTVFTWFLIKSPIHKIKFLTFQILPTLWVWPPTSFIYWRLPLWYQLFVTMPIFVPKDGCGAHSWEPQTMRAWQLPDVCWHHRTSQDTMMQHLFVEWSMLATSFCITVFVLSSLGVEATLARVNRAVEQSELVGWGREGVTSGGKEWQAAAAYCAIPTKPSPLQYQPLCNTNQTPRSPQASQHL